MIACVFRWPGTYCLSLSHLLTILLTSWDRRACKFEPALHLFCDSSPCTRQEIPSNRSAVLLEYGTALGVIFPFRHGEPSVHFYMPQHLDPSSSAGPPAGRQQRCLRAEGMASRCHINRGLICIEGRILRDYGSLRLPASVSCFLYSRCRLLVLALEHL